MPNESIITQLLRRKRFDNNMMNLDQDPNLSNPATALVPPSLANPGTQPGQVPNQPMQGQPGQITPEMLTQLQLQAGNPSQGNPGMPGVQPGGQQMSGGMPQVGQMSPGQSMGQVQPEPYSQLELLLSRLGLIQLPKPPQTATAAVRG